jgi:protein-disulfide isomerase
MPEQIEGPSLSMPVSESRDHISGPASAPVTLVEYGDYECSYCGQAYGILKELHARVGEQVRLVFRNFPLTQIHPHAGRAAEAAEAAAAQGRFQSMHDMLYEHQDALGDDDLVAYAAQLGLDLDRFQVDLTQGTHLDRIREDFMSGVRSGVNGTPTFFVNGRRLDGPWDLQSLMAVVTSALRRHNRGNSGHSAHHPHPG